jgi:cytochrome P450
VACSQSLSCVYSDKPHPAREWEDQICLLYVKLMKSPFRRAWDFKTKREMENYGRLLDQEMRAILERRLAAGASSNSADICSIAINQLEQEKGSLYEEDKVSIIHQLKTFYFAGHDTTATTISWAIWLLSQHPGVLKKVRDELNEHAIWGTENRDSAPTYEQLQKCEYLEAVLKETLRLYPPASGLSRYNADPDDTWNGYSIGNAVLLVQVYVMHRHPDLWKKPDDFIPARWLDGSEENLNSKFAAFSRGPRDCVRI